MAIPLFGTICLLAIWSTVTICYDHKGRRYGEMKRPAHSLRSFKLVYAWLSATTAYSVIAAFWNLPFAFALFGNPALLLSGMTLSVAATVLFVSAKKTLAAEYSPCFDAFLPGQIVRKGPYRYVRHPIYTANVVMLIGFFIASGSATVLFNTAVLASYYFVAARLEEKSLDRAFSDYAHYVRDTGRFLPKIS